MYPWKSASVKPVAPRTWCEARRFIRTTPRLHTLTDRQRAQLDEVTMVTRPVDLLSEEEQMMKESGELLYWIIEIRAVILKRAWTFSGMWLSSLLYQSCQLLHIIA